MAIELLEKENTRHELHHDLESFYWLLTWIILRYTAHNHSDGQLACHRLFDVDKPAVLKRDWLMHTPPLDNKASPLYILAEAMRQLTLQQTRIQEKGMTFSFVRNPPKIDAEPLTYALIELAFNAVTTHPGWQTFQDAPGTLPFKVPSKTYNAAGKTKTETRELRRSALADSQPGRDTSGGGSGPSMRCRTKKRRREEEDPSGHATESTITLPFERSSGERSQLANKKSKIQPVKIIHRMKGRRPGRNNR
jgi:hypothetical protein